MATLGSKECNTVGKLAISEIAGDFKFSEY